MRPALLARGSLFKRLGRDALHCLLPLLDLRSLGALDSAMTNRAEREEPWLPDVAQMDNKLLRELLTKRLRSGWLYSLERAKDADFPRPPYWFSLN